MLRKWLRRWLQIEDQWPIIICATQWRDALVLVTASGKVFKVTQTSDVREVRIQEWFVLPWRDAL